MARTCIGFDVPFGSNFEFWAEGTYKDECGNIFRFAVHPEDIVNGQP